MKDNEVLSSTESMLPKVKMMTMEDVSEHLQREFLEEITGAKEYLCAAKIADHAEDHYDSHYLMEMAKDEFTHAVFIHEFLEQHGVNIPEVQEKCFAEIKAEMEQFF